MIHRFDYLSDDFERGRFNDRESSFETLDVEETREKFSVCF